MSADIEAELGMPVAEAFAIAGAVLDLELQQRAEVAGIRARRWPNGEWQLDADMEDPTTPVGVRFLCTHGHDITTALKQLLDEELPEYQRLARLEDWHSREDGDHHWRGDE